MEICGEGEEYVMLVMYYYYIALNYAVEFFKYLNKNIKILCMLGLAKKFL